MISLRENEKILKIIRQHRSVIAGTIFLSVMLSGFVTFAFLRYDFNVLGYSWEIIIGAILIAALIIIYKIFIWHKNTLIVTNQRIIINDREGVFSRTVTELIYRDIHNISFKQVGISALLNRYGKLVMKTPSGSEIIFDKISSPAEVVRIINEIRGSIKDEPPKF